VAVSIDVGPAEFDLDVQGCFLGNAFEAAVEAAEGWVLGRLRGRLEDYAAGRIAERAAAIVADALPLHLDFAGFAVSAELARVDVDGSSGVTVTGAADVVWTGAPAEDVSTVAAEGEALPRAFGPG